MKCISRTLSSLTDDNKNKSMDNDAKRQRCKIFSTREVDIIKTFMEDNHSAMSAKFSDKITKKRQEALWQRLTDSVNSVGVSPRTVLQVKEKWRNMVKKAKSDFTAQRKSCQTTGGGPPLPDMSQTSQDIVDLFRDTASFSGVPGAMDCQSIILTFGDSPLTFPDTEETVTEAGDARHDSELPPSSHEKEEDPQVKETDLSEDTVNISGSGGSKKKEQRNVRSQKTLKELQIEYFDTGIQLQKAQLECFEKLSKLADMYLMKHSTV